MKYAKILAIGLISTSVLFGCSNEEEEITTESVIENTMNNLQENIEAKEETQEEKEVKVIGRNVVAELQKMLFRLDDYSSATKAQIDLYQILKNETAREKHLNFIAVYTPGDIYMKNISYNKNTESVQTIGKRLFYQVTTEANFLRNANEIQKDTTYSILFNKDNNGNIYIEDLSAEFGHLIEGENYLLTDKGMELMVKKKVKNLLKALKGIEYEKSSKIDSYVSSLFRNEKEAGRLVDSWNPSTGNKEMGFVVYDKNTLKVDTVHLEKKPLSLSIEASGAVGLVYKENGATKKEAYTFNILLTHKDAKNEDYFYVIEDIDIKPLQNFNWEMLKN